MRTDGPRYELSHKHRNSRRVAKISQIQSRHKALREEYCSTGQPGEDIRKYSSDSSSQAVQLSSKAGSGWHNPNPFEPMRSQVEMNEINLEVLISFLSECAADAQPWRAPAKHDGSL